MAAFKKKHISNISLCILGGVCSASKLFTTSGPLIGTQMLPLFKISLSRRKQILMSGDFKPDKTGSPQSAVYNISPHSSPWQPGEILTAHRVVKLLPFVWGYFKPTCVGFPTAGSKTTLLPWRRLLHTQPPPPPSTKADLSIMQQDDSFKNVKMHLKI